MKLKPMICPQCHANISFKPDQKVGFCSFCGTQIVLDDEVKTVHITKDVHIKKDVTYTHRTIDEARLKEAEVAEKREERKAKRMERKQHSKAKRRIVFLGIIVMAIAYAKIKGNIKDAKRVEFGKTLNQICTDHDANVSYLRDNSEYMSVDIKVDTYEKSDIDAFQQDLVDKLVIPKGSEFDVDFESKDGDLIRSIEITDSGVVTINKDNTNKYSNADMKAALVIYHDQLADKLKNRGTQIDSIKMHENQIKVSIYYNNYNSTKLNALEALIASVDSPLDDVPIAVEIKASDDRAILIFSVTENDKVHMITDNTSPLDDEEVRELRAEYKEAFSNLCDQEDVTLANVQYSGKTLEIKITSSEEYRDKEKCAALSEKMNDTLKGLTPYEVAFTLCDESEFGEIKTWTVEEDGTVVEEFDFSR